MKLLSIKQIRISTILFAGVLFSMSALGQEPGNDNDQMQGPTAPQMYAPFSLEAAGGLWYPATNYALKDNFGGVYSLHISAQYDLFKNLYGGLEFQNNEISQSTPVTFRIATATANQFFYNVGAKLSFYSSQSADWFFSFSIVAGESWMLTNKVQGIPEPPGGFKSQAVFFSPRVSESIKVNPQLRVGLEVSYNYYNYIFNPTSLGITRQYSGAQTTGNTTLIGWGFSANYFLGKSKR